MEEQKTYSADYSSIEEKEEKCKEIAGYNESLKSKNES